MNSLLMSCLDDAQASVDTLAQVLAQPLSASELTAASAAVNEQSFRLLALINQGHTAIENDATLVQRARRVGAMLASCQEHLARHATLADQALRMLLPTVRTDTYAGAMSGRPGQPYGSAGRSSGEFRAVSA